MSRYIHFDTTDLDRLSDVERYAAAGEAIEQARKAVAATAAYRDAVVAAMVAARPGRGGSAEVSRLLGIPTGTVSTHVKKHKEKLMQTTTETHTVTRYVPIAQQEVSRTWTRTLYPEELGGAPGPWETEVDGVRWALYYNGQIRPWAAPERRIWDWGPVGGGQEVPTIEAESDERALQAATWYLDVEPLIDAAQQN